MKTEKTPQETPLESTTVSEFSPFDDEFDTPLTQIEVINLQDVNHLVDASLFYLHNADDIDSDQQEFYKQQLLDSATELASHVLSKKSCEQLNINARILDNQSFNHPPIREDVFRLSAAAEILHNETLQKAYEAAIQELPNHLNTVKHRSERALGLVKSGRSDSFFHAYAEVELMENGNDTEGRKVMASHAKRFLDNGSIEEDTDYNKLDMDDERLERLVTPVPTSFDGEHGTHDEPRVEFYFNKKKAGQSAIDAVNRKNTSR